MTTHASLAILRHQLSRESEILDRQMGRILRLKVEYAERNPLLTQAIDETVTQIATASKAVSDLIELCSAEMGR